MPSLYSLITICLVGLAAAQTPGKTQEVHPKLTTWKCTKKNGCVKKNSAIVLDAATHPIHQLQNTNLGCGDWGNPPNATVCPDAKTCAKNCIVEGIPDYSKYGVTTKGNNLYLDMLTDSGSVLSPRVYLLTESGKKYEKLQLTGGEMSFDVDVSKLPCGMNGALYLSEMADTGGLSKLNPAGAAYGTGYCDAQCFVTPFLDGVGNVEAKGACCNEMDIWEANARATQFAPHTCNQTGLYGCTGSECAFDGVCDKNGCSYNNYAVGAKNFYGTGLKVDTTRPFTVVTQFPAKKGILQQIKRLYVQDGKIIQNAAVNITGLPDINYLDDGLCTDTGASRFMDLGAMKGMGDALTRGMVLVFSVWWDSGGYMNWLDTGNSGPCNVTEGSPAVIQAIQPDTAVTFSQIKWGELDSTYSTKH